MATQLWISIHNSPRSTAPASEPFRTLQARSQHEGSNPAGKLQIKGETAHAAPPAPAKKAHQRKAFDDSSFELSDCDGRAFRCGGVPDFQRDRHGIPAGSAERNPAVELKRRRRPLRGRTQSSRRRRQTADRGGCGERWRRGSIHDQAIEAGRRCLAFTGAEEDDGVSRAGARGVGYEKAA